MLVIPCQSGELLPGGGGLGTSAGKMAFSGAKISTPTTSTANPRREFSRKKKVVKGGCSE